MGKGKTIKASKAVEKAKLKQEKKSRHIQKLKSET